MDVVVGVHVYRRSIGELVIVLPVPSLGLTVGGDGSAAVPVAWPGPVRPVLYLGTLMDGFIIVGYVHVALAVSNNVRRRGFVGVVRTGASNVS